jgi:hypothetical protein
MDIGLAYVDAVLEVEPTRAKLTMSADRGKADLALGRIEV